MKDILFYVLYVKLSVGTHSSAIAAIFKLWFGNYYGFVKPMLVVYVELVGM